MKIIIFYIIVFLLIPLAYADVGNNIFHNSTLVWNPYNLTLSNTSKTLIGTDLYGIIRGNPILSKTGGLTTSGYVEFDGNDNIFFGSAQAILHHRTNDQNWSAICTIATTGITTSNQIGVIFGTIPSKGDGDNGGWGIFIDDRASNDEVGCALSIGNGWNLLTQGAITLVNDGKNHSIACVWNKTGAPEHTGTFYLDGVRQATNTVAQAPNKAPFNLTIGRDSGLGGHNYTGKISECKYVNRSLTGNEIVHEYNQTWNGTINQETGGPAAPDTTPPHITAYSDQGSSCSNWNTNTSNPCSTGDTTPTLYFNTSEAANCAIGINNLNYTTMESSRNCTSGEGTTEHACTLTLQDELVYEDSTVYLSCKDLSNNENITSTSGPLALTITGLESGGDVAIGVGIQNALLSGYTNYTNQQIYARKLDNTQDFGTFDWVAKKGSKVWAFNYITNGESHVGLFNLTPVLYVLEMANITNATITNTVETMINATK